MPDPLIEQRIEAFERAFDYDASYMKEVLALSDAAFLQLERLQGLAGYRADAPVALWYAAKLTASMHEDCGPCAQLVSTMALKDGVPAATVRAILSAREAEMGDEAALGYRFARAVLARDAAADALGAEIERRHGRHALVALAFGMAGSRAYPTIKYALGHGRACRAIRLPGEPELAVAGVAA